MKKTLLPLFLLLSVCAFTQRLRIVDNKLLLPEAIQFKTGTADILPESETTLKNIKLFLDEKTFVSLLRIEGHVVLNDAVQSQTLSEQRAQAVVKWLVKNGADCKRLLAVGFGDTKPLVDKASADAAKNNRIEFAVASLNGHAVGGMPVDGGGKAVNTACE